LEKRWEAHQDPRRQIPTSGGTPKEKKKRGKSSTYWKCEREKVPLLARPTGRGDWPGEMRETQKGIGFCAGRPGAGSVHEKKSGGRKKRSDFPQKALALGPGFLRKKKKTSVPQGVRATKKTKEGVW